MGLAEDEANATDIVVFVLPCTSAKSFAGGKVNKEQMARVMDKIFEACTVLRSQGQLEYAHKDDDAFDNFNRLSKMLNMPREKVLMVYFVKHLDGIAAHVNGHKSQREDVRGRIKDAIVYLCLLYGMIDEEEALTAPATTKQV